MAEPSRGAKRALGAPGTELAAPQPKRRRAGAPGPGQPLPVPLASLTGVEASNTLWAVYRGHLRVRAQGEVGPQGRGASVVVTAREEVAALQVHGVFGVVVRGRWEDQARLLVEEWRPGEEEHQPESWGEVKEQEEQREEGGGEEDEELHLELCEAFFLSYGLGCLVVRRVFCHRHTDTHAPITSSSRHCAQVREEGRELGLLDLWARFAALEDDFPLRSPPAQASPHFVKH